MVENTQRERGERDRERQRQRETETERDRQRDRQRNRQTDRQIETERQRQTEGDIQTDREQVPSFSQVNSHENCQTNKKITAYVCLSCLQTANRWSHIVLSTTVIDLVLRSLRTNVTIFIQISSETVSTCASSVVYE